MTKARPPLSYADAAKRIVDFIGIDRTAAIVKRSPRAIYHWTDPDMPTLPSIDQALALDLAFQQAGGIGAPMLETYAALADMLGDNALSDPDALSTLTETVSRESGEAVAAMIAASRPGAGFHDINRARAEGFEAVIQALSAPDRQRGDWHCLYHREGIMTDVKRRRGRKPTMPMIECPHCRAPARCRNSARFTALVREARCECSNVECDHIFSVSIEITRTLRPSAEPNPEIMIPIAPPRANNCPANDNGEPVTVPPAANDAASYKVS